MLREIYGPVKDNTTQQYRIRTSSMVEASDGDGRWENQECNGKIRERKRDRDIRRYQ